MPRVNTFFGDDCIGNGNSNNGDYSKTALIKIVLRNTPNEELLRNAELI